MGQQASDTLTSEIPKAPECALTPELEALFEAVRTEMEQALRHLDEAGRRTMVLFGVTANEAGLVSNPQTLISVRTTVSELSWRADALFQAVLTARRVCLSTIRSVDEIRSACAVLVSRKAWQRSVEQLHETDPLRAVLDAMFKDKDGG